MDLELKRLPSAWLEKASLSPMDQGPGEFTGYPSVFGVIDDGGDIVMPGAFSQFLADFLERGFIADSHQWTLESTLAYPVSASEDSYGLLTTCRFHTKQAAQDARSVVAERLAAGLKVLLSIGFFIHGKEWLLPSDYEERLPGIVPSDRLPEMLEKAKAFPKLRLLTNLQLAEYSLVTVPMLPDAEVTTVKTADVKSTTPAEVKAASILGPYAITDAGMAAARDLMYSLFWEIGYDVLGDGEATPEDRIALWEAGCDEFKRLTSGVFRALIEAGPEAMEEGAKSLREMFADPSCTAVRLDDLTYGQHAAQVAAVAKSFGARTQRRLEFRAQEGRTLSAQQASDCAGIAQELKAAAASLEAVAQEPTARPDASAEVRRFQTDVLVRELQGFKVRTG